MANSRTLATWVGGIFLALALLAAMASPAQAQGPAGFGPFVYGDTAACRPGSGVTAALVTVHGFKDRQGQLRIQNYTGLKGEFLESGKYLRRHDIPMSRSGDMIVCLTLPGPGSYVIVALHDRDTDGKLSVWSDGIGFTNNPHIRLAKPSPEETVIPFGPGVTPVRIVMNYRRGLSVKPLAE